MLDQISMVCANFGNGQAFPIVLEDWFKFLGGKPGEVVVVDGGSEWKTQAMYLDLMRAGKLDKLQLIAPSHPENDKDKCFIQEYMAGSLGTRPYLLFWKSDTLPFRKGQDHWVQGALRNLDLADIFAVGGSFNYGSRHHEESQGWYFSHKCSENFALMKRQTFVLALEEFAGEFIRSGFRGTNPADVTGQGRFLVEVAFEHYMARHHCYTLVKEESLNWIVAHTNLRGDRLLEARERFFAGSENAGYLKDLSEAKEPHGVYFGMPRAGWHSQARTAVGNSPVGPIWRKFKQAVASPFNRA